MSRQFDDLQLGSIELFCAAAESGSFSAAAAAVGITPAAVSRTVARMEQRIGVRLFTRTTRRVRLTEAGARYFEHCRAALNSLRAAEREASTEQVVPSGILRVSVPTTYGHHRLLPLLPEFHARYPRIRVEVQISNRNVDLAADGFDVAIRMRAPADSSLVARPLEQAPLVVVAAPDYLRRNGTPRRVEDLQRHECIQFLRPDTGRRMPWLFKVGGRQRKLNVPGSLTCSEDVLGCVTLARSGAGLFQIMRFVVEQELRNGTLVELLQPYACGSRQVTLLYSHARTTPARVRAFVDFMVGAMHDRS